MSGGLLDVTLVSASIAPYSAFDNELCNLYAVLKCAREHQRTSDAEDQGRLPVWNEFFSFEISQEDMSTELLIQVFNVNGEADQLLGIGRIPILDMIGKEEATLCALINPIQGEIGKLKAVWNWKPGSQKLHTATSSESKSALVAYPSISKSSANTSHGLGKLEAVSDALAKLSMDRRSKRYSALYPENTGNFGNEEKAQEGEYYSFPPAPEGYSVAYPSFSRKQSASYTEDTANFEREEEAEKLEYHSYPPSAPEEYLVAHSPISGKYSALYPEDYGDFCKDDKAEKREDYSSPFSAPEGCFALHPFISGNYLAPCPEDTGDFGKEKAQKGEHYSNPPALNIYSAAHTSISETCAKKGAYDYAYPPPNSDAYSPVKGIHSSSMYAPPGSTSDAYPPEKDSFHAHSNGMYPPSADTYLPSNQGYRQSSPDSAFPSSNQAYPPVLTGSIYSLPPSVAYPPDSAAYPPFAAPYSSRNESWHDHASPTDWPSGGFAYPERENGDMERCGSGDEKVKKHGSYTSHDQPLPSGYPPSSYSPTPTGYSQYGHPPGGYPPAPYGYPQDPHGYPPALHGYSPQFHGYPPASQDHPSAGYPPQHPPAYAGPGYPMQEYTAYGRRDGS